MVATCACIIIRPHARVQAHAHAQTYAHAHAHSHTAAHQSLFQGRVVWCEGVCPAAAGEVERSVADFGDGTVDVLKGEASHAWATCHARMRMSHVTRVCYTSQAHAASAAGFTCVALTGRVLYESRLLHMSNTVACHTRSHVTHGHMSNTVSCHTRSHKGGMSHASWPLHRGTCTRVT